MELKDKKIQRSISTLLILSILLPSFLFLTVPKKAEADILDDACGALFGKAGELIDKGLKKLGKKFIGSAVSTSVPVNDSGVRSNTGVTASKNQQPVGGDRLQGILDADC